VEFQRDMRFDFVMLMMLWRKVQVFAIAMFLTIWLDNYWILVLANFGNRLISVPVSYLFIKPYRPRFSFAAWHELFHFSKWLFLGNICTLADSQVMNFIVGHYLGVTKVGMYQIGNQIAGLPLSEIAAPIRAPFYTAFARLRHDAEHLRRVFLDGLAVQCLVIVPMTVGIACTAPEISGIFLGSRWAAVIPLLPFIALYQLFDASGHYTHNILIALNRQKLYTLTYYCSIAVRIPLTIWLALADGLRGAVIAMLITAAVNAVLWNAQVNRLLRISARRTLTVCWRPLVASGVMAAVLAVLSQQLLAGPDPAGIFFRFGLKVVGGAVIYFVLIAAFWLMAGAPERSPEAYALRVARSVFGRVESLLQFRRRPAG
ncbi:MAG: oligosaccharide flippase family protein, partial [Acetobacteraceae bacterium]